MGKPLMFGLVAGSGASDDAAAALVRALEHELRTPIEVHRAADYRTLVSALEGELVDLAWLPPLGAARAAQGKRAVPVAVAVRDGAASYMTGLFAPAGGPVRTVADLHGVRAGWVDRESASGYVVLRAAMRAAGVRLAAAFGQELFLRTHAEVARALRDGRIDVGATCFRVVGGELRIARDTSGLGLRPGEVTLVAEGGPIPSDILAVRAARAESLLAPLQRVLIDRRGSPAQRAAAQLMVADELARPTAAHAAMIEALARLLQGAAV